MSIIYLLNNYVNTFYTFMKKFLITVAVIFFSLRKDLFRDTTGKAEGAFGEDKWL